MQLLATGSKQAHINRACLLSTKNLISMKPNTKITKLGKVLNHLEQYLEVVMRCLDVSDNLLSNTVRYMITWVQNCWWGCRVTYPIHFTLVFAIGEVGLAIHLLYFGFSRPLLLASITYLGPLGLDLVIGSILIIITSPKQELVNCIETYLARIKPIQWQVDVFQRMGHKILQNQRTNEVIKQPVW